MPSRALKEWAVICEALAEGRQAILLRKGGVAEPGDAFRVADRRFWLYPTFVHQQRDGMKSEAHPLLEAAQERQPHAGVVRLSLLAELAGEWLVRDLETLLALDDLHLWSPDTVRSRFAYRSPGLHVLLLRVSRLPSPIDIAEQPGFAGCRSWVDLGETLPETGASPVMAQAEFEALADRLSLRLRAGFLA